MRAPGFLNLKRKPFVPCEIASCDAPRRHDLEVLSLALDAAGIPATPAEQDRVEAVSPEQLSQAKTAAQKLEAKTTQGGSVIHAFNEKYDVAEILKAHGYVHAGEGRMNRPGGRSRGVHLLDGLSFHFSSNDGLNDGHFGHFTYHTPFSAYCALKHGGNVGNAVRGAAVLMGIEHKHPQTTRRFRITFRCSGGAR